jgi:hypothetical protein
MEQVLSGLFGGSAQQHQEAQQYVQRYEQGPPTEGISDQEVQQHYQRVAQHVPPGVYQKAAEEAFSRLSPQERQQFIKQVKQHAQKQKEPRAANWNESDDSPAQLAQLMTHAQQNQPDLVNQLVGSVGGGNPLMKAALGGIAAMAMKQVMGNR